MLAGEAQDVGKSHGNQGKMWGDRQRAEGQGWEQQSDEGRHGGTAMVLFARRGGGASKTTGATMSSGEGECMEDPHNRKGPITCQGGRRNEHLQTD